ncbi:MAG: hypothetical protein K0R25_1367 [Rickettsiaceae bacterium]|jgi:hypothetical protein|nr:hypothetical protein [Rickettsiaceae bacterium]
MRPNNSPVILNENRTVATLIGNPAEYFPQPQNPNESGLSKILSSRGRKVDTLKLSANQRSIDDEVIKNINKLLPNLKMLIIDESIEDLPWVHTDQILEYVKRGVQIKCSKLFKTNLEKRVNEFTGGLYIVGETACLSYQLDPTLASVLLESRAILSKNLKKIGEKQQKHTPHGAIVVLDEEKDEEIGNKPKSAMTTREGSGRLSPEHNPCCVVS